MADLSAELANLNVNARELFQIYDGQFRKLEDKANALKHEWQKIADEAKKQIDTTNRLVNEKIEWADREIKKHGFTLTVVSSGYGGGTNNTSSGVFINNRKVFNPSRSQNICVIDIKEQKIVSSGRFDTYGNASKADECAEYIKTVFNSFTGSRYLIVFCTFDEPANNLNDNLKSTVAKYFKADLFGTNRKYRDAYLCVYRNGIGKLAEKLSSCGDCNNSHVAVQMHINN